ncbi:MAG TPA: SPOR domain-containing protein, partial [Acidobacteriaceae bacterium]
MAYLFETEEDEETGRRTLGRKRRAGRKGREEDEADAEITLGSRSLLGIFFGLVLICAIFFGLGYSVGRGSAAKTAVVASGSEATAGAPNGSIGKPSPQQTLAEAPATDTNAGTAPANGAPEDNAPALEAAAAPAPTGGSASAGGSGASAAAPAAASVKPAGFPSAVPGAANPARPAVVTTTIPSGIMVQVAAISVPQDADILVEALKKRGYTAVLRNEPQDKLLHVQLGPYATRAEANAVRG